MDGLFSNKIILYIFKLQINRIYWNSYLLLCYDTYKFPTMTTWKTLPKHLTSISLATFTFTSLIFSVTAQLIISRSTEPTKNCLVCCLLLACWSISMNLSLSFVRHTDSRCYEESAVSETCEEKFVSIIFSLLLAFCRKKCFGRQPLQ